MTSRFKFQLTLEEIFTVAELDGGWEEMLGASGEELKPDEVEDKDFRKTWRRALKHWKKMESIFDELNAFKPDTETETEEEDDEEDGRFKLH